MNDSTNPPALVALIIAIITILYIAGLEAYSHVIAHRFSTLRRA